MRTYLKVKIKSLAAEAGIIRLEERKAKTSARQLRIKQREADAERHYALYNGLREHRKREVREEARASQLAYAFLRSRPYATTEPQGSNLPMGIVKKAISLANRYGPHGKETSDRFEAWVEGTVFTGL